VSLSLAAHANAAEVEEYLAKKGRKVQDYVPISDDLMGLKVLSAEEVEPMGQYVYDFSVQDDENFVCGRAVGPATTPMRT